MKNRWLIAPQAFKGTISARKAAQGIGDGIKLSYPQDEVILFPIADGGDDTLELLLSFFKGTEIQSLVSGPFGQKVLAAWGIIQNEALIEMAQICGFGQLNSQPLDPLKATTRGVGEVIREALERGIRQFIITLGGTVTMDGGAGLLQALGVSLQDEKGHELSPGGGSLIQLAQIDLKNLDPRIQESTFKIVCDVQTPLEKSASVYAAQKGASSEQTHQLGRALHQFAQVILAETGTSVHSVPRGGAAGGAAIGLMAFFNGELVDGSDFILDLLHLDEILAKVDYAVIGEGQLDEQTLANKGPWAVAKRAQKRGVPVFAIVGKVKPGFSLPENSGIVQVITLGQTSQDPEQKLKAAAQEIKITSFG